MCQFADGTRAATAASHCSNGVAAMSIAHVVIQSVAWESPKQKRKLFGRLSKTALVLAITNRTSPLYSQNKTGGNSNRNSVRVLAW